jgi:hypothetical protein
VKNNKKNQSLELINKIQKIRSKNNINWMDMLSLAFKHDTINSSIIMSKIYIDDQKISKLDQKLYKINIK